jgi:hypothetical protein
LEDEESDPDTNPTDVDTDIERDDEVDVSCPLDEDKDHLPEYYLNQEDELDESELDEDYSDDHGYTIVIILSSLPYFS